MMKPRQSLSLLWALTLVSATLIRHDDSLLAANSGGQESFLRDWRHTYVALEGGWGSGKTFAGAWKLLVLHVHNSRDDEDAATFCPSAVVAPTYANANDFCVPALLNLCERFSLSYQYHQSGTIAAGRYAAPGIVLSDLGTRTRPSVILIRTADSPERITGWEVGAYWCDEPARYRESEDDPRSDPLVQIIGRLRFPKANRLQGLYTYTNEGDHTRIYNEFHAGDMDHALYRARTDENEHVRTFCDQLNRTLPDHLKKQYLEGGAISLSGAKVYGIFDRELNIDDKLALSNDLPLQMSLDFNISPGMHALIGQQWEAHDLLTCVHEIHESRLSVRDLIPRFRDWIATQGGFKWPRLEIFGDATGRAESASTGDSCYAILHQGLDKLGIDYMTRVPTSNPFEADRVNAVTMAMRDVDGSPRYKVHSRCKRLLDDFRRVKYDKRGKIDKKSVDLTHASDAEGYRIHFVRPVRVEVPHEYGRFGVG